VGQWRSMRVLRRVRRTGPVSRPLIARSRALDRVRERTRMILPPSPWTRTTRRPSYSPAPCASGVEGHHASVVRTQQLLPCGQRAPEHRSQVMPSATDGSAGRVSGRARGCLTFATPTKPRRCRSPIPCSLSHASARRCAVDMCVNVRPESVPPRHHPAALGGQRLYVH
jgi:hypothetical protein